MSSVQKIRMSHDATLMAVLTRAMKICRGITTMSYVIRTKPASSQMRCLGELGVIMTRCIFSSQ